MRKIRFGLGPKMRGFLRASIIACAATVGCALALTPGQRAVLLAGVGSFVQQGTTPWLTTETNSAAILAAVQGAIPAGTSQIGNVGMVYPAGSTPITASATGTTGATTATLAANASLHTFICGLSIRANATAAATANSTVTGTVTGTLNFTQWTAPAASGIGLTEQIFQPCIISSAVNTGIAVISAAPGTGGVVSVTAWGYQGPT